MTLPPLRPEEFSEVFQAVHGYSPFPWQARLAASLAATGAWPEAFNLPTASGKTATLDAALFHLALEADRGEARKAPIRTAFVVDRRIIVDEAADRADRIAAALAEASDGSVLGRMALRLRHLSGDHAPALLVRRLRGGMPREDDWARSPNQPTILCSTVDQVGSRLLFRGYGVSGTMAPVHAGLLGSDCLLLLDEAHLAAPFVQTLHRVAAYRAPPWCERPSGPWAVATLTATPQAAHVGFTLDAKDRSDAVLSKRLAAAKPAKLRVLKLSAREAPDDHAAAFADAARELRKRDGIRTLAVVVNRVALARGIFRKLLDENTDGAEVILLTGRIRGLDRDRLAAAYAPRLRSGAKVEGGPLLVVATQTIEAGADFDFDALVTQAAPLDALRQRFGRLNRMGREVPSQAIIVAAKDEIAARADDAIYGDRVRKTWVWLTQNASKTERKGAEPIFDFGIDASDRVFAAEPDEIGALASVKADAPILRPADVMLLSWTAPVPAIDPAIWLFLHGPQTSMPDVAIVWRADLTDDTLDQAGDVLALVPPHIGETLAVPLWAARAWLSGARREAAETGDLEGVPANEELDATKLRPRGAFRWAGAEASATGVIAPNLLRPGDIIVVPAAYGGCDAFGWDPTAVHPVTDLGDQRPQSLLSVRRLHPDLQPEIWSAIAPVLDRYSDLELRERLQALADAGVIAASETWKICWPFGYQGVVLVGLRRNPDGLAAATENDQSGSLAPIACGLAAHRNAVAAMARRFATASGLSPERVEDIALAALLHDDGKADQRFQIWLHGGDRMAAVLDGEEPLAKSSLVMSMGESRAARAEAGLPDCWRHEAQSVTRAMNDLRTREAADPELVIWLIGTHHGHGRPLFPHNDAREDADHLGPQRLDFQYDGYDWPQIYERLKARYGLWELARMEAVLRLADHRVSAEAS